MPRRVTERTLRGLPAAPGTAAGPAWRHHEAAPSAPPVLDLDAAAARAAADLEALAARTRDAGHEEEAAILDAQALMAQDPMLLDDAAARMVEDADRSPEAMATAVVAAAAAAAEVLAGLPDPLLAARAADVRDVGARIGRIISGRALALPSEPAIAIADDLPPSVTAEVPAGFLLGIALEGGSPVSHAAILARGLGIPAVVAVPGLGAALDAAIASDPADGAGPMVAIDGEAGTVVIGPTPAELAELEVRAGARRERASEAAQLRGRPGRTADGVPVPLVANIGRPDDAVRALERGAEGVGLFRTEFLFLGRTAAPSEDEQAHAYAEVLTAFGPDRHVVIRLADIGGDKEIPYLQLAHEANPFLGVRGLRLAWDDRALLVTQLRAIARAGAAAGVVPHVMAPMVADTADVALLHELVAEAEASLDRDGVARAPALEVGIMVEVPSAALCAAELAADVAFFSIGSNDLTQYVLAMDRTSARLAAAADGLHPAVLRAIRATVAGADAHGIPVAVCGELASDPSGALVLVGLGVDELSMDAGALDAVRMALHKVTLAQLQGLAEAALGARTAAEVRALAAPLLA